MTRRQITTNIATGAAFGGFILAGIMIGSTYGRAANDNNAEQDQKLKIQTGFQVAPVPLNLVGKDHDLVGLGSFLVNVQGDCNGCHTNNPATEFADGGNPVL